ncbi:MAG: PLDc N-terminal domain-containing protein [Blastocatellia bacterium]|nr:PLDc N-terminal domain-containing protein [Blastocatellia bacterium]
MRDCLSLFQREVLLVLITISAFVSAGCGNNSDYKSVPYAEFLNYVEQGKLIKCTITQKSSSEFILIGQLGASGPDNGDPTVIQAELSNERTVSALIEMMRQKRVDIEWHSRNEPGLILMALPFGLVIFALAGFAFWLWMLVECATKERSEGNDKMVWVLIILLANVIGAMIYFIFRRPKRKKESYA